MADNSRLVAAAACLRADVAAAEAVQSLRRVGVEPILLRGPVLARLLYADEPQRTYNDVDLLVAPAHVELAENALARLGFAERTVAGAIPGTAPRTPTRGRGHETGLRLTSTSPSVDSACPEKRPGRYSLLN